MKVAGRRIKQRRLRYGLSQHRLAKGICAQATISLIENQNSCPNLKILTKISNRLSIPIKLMVKSSFRSMDVERAILSEKYHRAESTLLRIPQRKFRFHQQMHRYFCYRGVFSIVKNNYSDALYFFNKVLSLDLNSSGDYYCAWANVGISYVYFKRRDTKKAFEFATNAQRSLNLDVDERAQLSIQLFMKIRLTLAWLFNRLGRYKTSNSVCFQTVTDSVKLNSMYKLAKVYRQINRNYVSLNQIHNADLARIRAELFCKVYQNPELLQ